MTFISDIVKRAAERPMVTLRRVFSTPLRVLYIPPPPPKTLVPLVWRSITAIKEAARII
jgi:hypothetical protein